METPDVCPECGRTIERDELNGKPAGAKGYCQGTDTCLQRSEVKYAVVDDRLGRITPDEVRAYMPENYKVEWDRTLEKILIYGHDVAGWTMEDYVIPRLASGAITARKLEGLTA